MLDHIKWERILRPHIWPLLEPDYPETVARGGLCINFFGQKSTYWTLYHAKNYTPLLGVVEAASASVDQLRPSLLHRCKLWKQTCSANKIIFLWEQVRSRPTSGEEYSDDVYRILKQEPGTRLTWATGKHRPIWRNSRASNSTRRPSVASISAIVVAVTRITAKLWTS